MRYFMDTEFIEDGKTIDLISIGIVCEDGREFYAVNAECNFFKASSWVRANVLTPMGICLNGDQWKTTAGVEIPFRSKGLIRFGILEFLRIDLDAKKEPEFWAYYADYDWVVFCQLFGTMMDLPKGFPMYCRDIKQECDRLGNPKLPEQGKGEHNALDDARWNKKAFEFLAAIASEFQPEQPEEKAKVE